MKLSLQQLDDQISRLYRKFFSKHPESLRSQLSDSPTQYQDVFRYWDLTSLVFGTKRRREFQRISILSWYFPEEVRVLVQLNLKEYWDRVQVLNVEKEILLSSKELALAWILRESGWTESTFFGNILNREEVSVTLRRISFKRVGQSRVKKYTGYCRGYRESNPGAPRSVPKELLYWVVDEEVIEKRRLDYINKVTILTNRLLLFLSQECSRV